MAFLKAQWQLIVMGVVCLAAVGGGALAVTASSGIAAKMNDIQGLVAKVVSGGRNPANIRTIEAKKQELEERKAEFEQSVNTALDHQKYNSFYEEVDKDGKVTPKLRETIIPDVLPEPKSTADAIQFRMAYVEEFKKLARKLRGSAGPTTDDIGNEESLIRQLKAGEEGETSSSGWGPPTAAKAGHDRGMPAPKKASTLPEFLREYPPARAAESVALQIYMYVDNAAFGMHPLAERAETPAAVDIWQAQMSLWIQQDIAFALARCNKEREEELRKRGMAEPYWVAYMPVKRLKRVAIAPQLGRGWSANWSGGTSPSFTGLKNDDKRFIVPLQIHMIVEEAAIMNVVGQICSVGFYCPTSISYRSVPPDPLYEDGYIYGEDPVVDLTLDLEGYYFRAVFEQWIPKELKQALKTPDCKEEEGEGRTGRG